MPYQASLCSSSSNERVFRFGREPAIRRTQAAGQHEVIRLQGPSHGCSYRGREVVILLQIKYQVIAASRDDITASQLWDIIYGSHAVLELL